MRGIIKLQAGKLVRALGIATLPLREQQARHMPMLGAVHLAGNSDGLSITATTFDGTITTSLEARAEGEVAVPLERLSDLVAHFSADAEITIAADDSTATVACGRSRFKLPVFPIADLPERHAIVDEIGRVELDTKAARELFSRPAFAASTEATRFYLNGIFLHNIGDNLVAVATDGHRLCRITTPAVTVLSADRGLIVANAVARTIGRLLARVSGGVTLRRSTHLFSVEVAAFTLVTKRVDAEYPSYERLIQIEAPNTVTVDRARLLEALERFAAVANPQEKTHVVTLCWDADGLHLNTVGGSADQLVTDVEGEARTAAQIRHLTELIGAMRGMRVRVGLSDPNNAILITDPDDPDFTALQMPFRV